MTSAKIEKLVWVLIYGGLLAVALGISVARGGHWVSWCFGVLGVMAVVAGVVLIVVRSRMKEEGVK